MRTMSLLLVIGVVAVVTGLTTLASERADKDDAAIFLSEVPEGYRDWKLIAVSRLTTSNGSGPAAKPDTPKTTTLFSRVTRLDTLDRMSF